MAENYGIEKVLELMNAIIATLQEYEKQTDNMINAELEVLQQGLIARNELIETLEDLKGDLETVVDLEETGEQVLLKALINGSYVNVPLDDDHKKVQHLQKSIAMLKQRIVDKDKIISGQFKERHVDSRRELEQLKQTKQKIGYYNSATVGKATGQSLNKNL